MRPAEMRDALQRHAGLRRAMVLIEQLVCAAAVYFVAERLWAILSSGHGRPGVVTVVAATAVVALFLRISRRSFERLANWAAFGNRAVGYELVSGFVKHLEASLEMDDVLPRLAETAARTLGGSRGKARVWLADGSSSSRTWSSGADEGASEVVVPIYYGGDLLGEIAVTTAAAEVPPHARRLLDQLAAPAGLALASVRLTYDLRRRAGEIESAAAQISQSRRRIVSARRREQERFRREIDEQVRPHLVSARAVLFGAGRRNSEPDMSTAAGHVSIALEKLQLLARGVFPPRLSDVGLAESLRCWAEQHGLLLSLTVAGDADRLRDNQEVATLLYFCSVSVLTNVAGHAALTIIVDKTQATAEMHLGPESSAALDSDMLLAIADRAEAFGGSTAIAEGDDCVVRVLVPFVTGQP